MKDTLSTTTILLQYADNTMHYGYGKNDELQNCADIISETKSWSKNNNLAFIKELDCFFSLVQHSQAILGENEITDNFPTCNKIEVKSRNYCRLNMISILNLRNVLRAL